jgi:hypothetical protein
MTYLTEMDRADGLISPEMSRDKGRELHAAYYTATWVGTKREHITQFRPRFASNRQGRLAGQDGGARRRFDAADFGAQLPSREAPSVRAKPTTAVPMMPRTSGGMAISLSIGVRYVTWSRHSPRILQEDRDPPTRDYRLRKTATCTH